MSMLMSHSCGCTGYYPTARADGSAEARREGGPVDRFGRRLMTLQRHLVGIDPYVSVAMDKYLDLPNGMLLWIPSFDAHYRKPLVFRVVDTGDDFDHMGFLRLDICTMDKRASEDDFLNGLHEIFPLITSNVK